VQDCCIGHRTHASSRYLSRFALSLAVPILDLSGGAAPLNGAPTYVQTPHPQPSIHSAAFKARVAMEASRRRKTFHRRMSIQEIA